MEDRNHTGIMLIDRNDELCILYEKANTQEEVMRKGGALGWGGGVKGVGVRAITVDT